MLAVHGKQKGVSCLAVYACRYEGQKTWIWVPAIIITLVVIISPGTANLFDTIHIPEVFNMHFSLTVILGGREGTYQGLLCFTDEETQAQKGVNCLSACGSLFYHTANKPRSRSRGSRCFTLYTARLI